MSKVQHEILQFMNVIVCYGIHELENFELNLFIYIQYMYNFYYKLAYFKLL